MTKYIFFLLISLSPSITTHISGGRYFIIWNVGQGLWTTAVDGVSCEHFDMGGEFFAWPQIFKQCQNKDNKTHLSHWDWDHIGALEKFNLLNRLKNFCIDHGPQGKSSRRKLRILNRYPRCQHSDTTKKMDLKFWQPKIFNNTNESSSVFLYETFLIPGDSSIPQEKTWAHLSWTAKARVLVLGHHGSKTSTSADLLRHLLNVRMAVSSARYKRYGHPHSDVQLRLTQAHVGLLKTEDWGNLWFEK